MSRRTKARWSGVLVLLVVAAGAWLLWPRQKVIAGEDPLARTCRFAPSTAIGVVHLDVKRIVESIDAILDENLVSRRGKREALPTILRKIDSMDAYQLGIRNEPNLLLAFYGAFGAEDVAALEQVAGDTVAVGIQKGRNGRYQVHLGGLPVIESVGQFPGGVLELLLVLGDEADDVPSGMALVGLPRTLTPEFLKTLGKASNKALPALLKGVDTSADVWGAIGDSAAKGENDPISGKVSLFLLTKGRSKVEALLDSAEAARKVAKEIQESPVTGKLLRELADFQVKDDLLTIASKTTDPVLSEIIAAWARELAKRTGPVANLVGIAKALALYANDHGDTWPLDLETLVKDGQRPELFVSPSSGRDSPYDAKGRFRSDYIYIKGIPNEGPGYLIVAYERPELSDFKRVLVVDFNGSVSVLEPQEFKSAIDKTAKWFKENRKTLTLDPETRQWLKTIGKNAAEKTN